MAITKSAKKSIRQTKRRKVQNLVYKNKIKNLIKNARTLVLQKKANEAKKLLPAIYEILDKSAKVGVIKKNAASRRKSRMAKLIDKSSK
ncbi:MAG: 30S ribosomal protein S20 [Candidatus Staskawiczbacteria bacterium]|nr:30S ribosomal protein S20 [Candidatus Staskawiczbacteria bacterium]